MKDIIVKLHEITVNDKVLPPDILIDIGDILTYTYSVLDDHTYAHGIQYDNMSNYSDVLSQCDVIAKNIIELKNIIQNSKELGDNKNENIL